MKKVKLEPLIRKLFAYRPDEAYTYEEVVGQFHRWKAEAFRCGRGEICIKAGMPAKEFAVVVSGAAHVRMPSPIGDDILIRAVRPGEYVGLPLVYAPGETYPYDVVATVATELITFRVDEVRQWRTDPKSQPLYDFIGRLMGKTIRDAEVRTMVLSGKDIAERLRRYLAFRIERDGSRTVAIPGTSADLANYLGVNKCALSRTIARLRAEGSIEFEHNVFTVP